MALRTTRLGNPRQQEIRSQHIGGRVRSSTFRLTLAAILKPALVLELNGPKRLIPDSEQALTTWIRSHLSVAVHGYRDRDSLGALEDAVLDRLDPPLNLGGRPPTELRSRLTKLRRVIVQG